jgi:hypothetical protein
MSPKMTRYYTHISDSAQRKAWNCWTPRPHAGGSPTNRLRTVHPHIFRRLRRPGVCQGNARSHKESKVGRGRQPAPRLGCWLSVFVAYILSSSNGLRGLFLAADFLPECSALGKRKSGQGIESDINPMCTSSCHASDAGPANHFAGLFFGLPASRMATGPVRRQSNQYQLPRFLESRGAGRRDLPRERPDTL